MHGETNVLTESFGGISMNEKILLGCLAALIIFFGIVPEYNFASIRANCETVD
jgi:NADH:ubiquinone oxidoreductase subunit 4 (subunit M)